MSFSLSAPAYGESRLLNRMSERGGETMRESGNREGVLANTRHDLGNLARHILRLDIIGAAGDVIHAPISLVQDVGNGVAKTIDR